MNRELKQGRQPRCNQILVDILAEKKMSQRQAARFIGVGEVTFGYWINGVNRPRDLTREQIDRFNELVGIEFTEIFPKADADDFDFSLRQIVNGEASPAKIVSLFNSGILRAERSQAELLHLVDLRRVMAENIKRILTKKEARALELYFFEDRTLKECSKVLGISRQGVGSLKTEAIEKLRRRGRRVLAQLVA